MSSNEKFRKKLSVARARRKELREAEAAFRAAADDAIRALAPPSEGATGMDLLQSIQREIESIEDPFELDRLIAKYSELKEQITKEMATAQGAKHSTLGETATNVKSAEKKSRLPDPIL